MKLCNIVVLFWPHKPMSKRLTSSMGQISLNYATEYLGVWIFLFSIAPLFCPIPPLLPWSLYSQGIGGCHCPGLWRAGNSGDEMAPTPQEDHLLGGAAIQEVGEHVAD